MMTKDKGIHISTMDELTSLSEEMLTDALDSFSRTELKRELVYLNIYKLYITYRNREVISIEYEYSWHSTFTHGIPIGSIKMLMLTR